MTPLRLTFAALLATAAGVSAPSAQAPAGPIAPAATAVLVQLPAACSTGTARPGAASIRPGAPAPPLPAAARRLVAAGADLTLVCGPADATAAVLRAAVGHDAVLGSGPDVRAALTLAAADHPAQRFGPLR